MSEAGLIGLTRVWALELGPEGVTKRVSDAIPVRRMGTLADVARTAAYLLDAQAGFVTGQTIYVCGGLTVGVSPV